MSDKKELKEKDLTDEELKKVVGGQDYAEMSVTCPRCGHPGCPALIDWDTMEILDICCTDCGLGMAPKHQ